MQLLKKYLRVYGLALAQAFNRETVDAEPDCFLFMPQRPLNRRVSQKSSSIFILNIPEADSQDRSGCADRIGEQDVSR